MQPILVISRQAEMVEVARDMTSDPRRIVILEPDWRRALKLATRLSPAFILLDTDGGRTEDAFELARLLWMQTGRPILFLGGGTTTVTPMAGPARACGAALDGWTEMTSDDVAVSKRPSLTSRSWGDLVRRAPHRIG